MTYNKGNDRAIKKVFGALAIAIFCLSFYPSSQEPQPLASKLSKNQWVDSVFNALTEDQRLGQLFMVAAYSNRDETHYREIERLVREYHLGGLIFFQGGPGRQAVLTNRYQKAAKVPLLIGMDLEWGLKMRLDSTIQFPRAQVLGAIAEDEYIYQMGKEIARQCRELGVHINFAPVVDVNSNPKNPVIGNRSFGEDKYNVARKGIAYMKGMQEHGVLASAKHFPGHGDTDSDSHYTLPVLKHSKARLDTLELYPFKELIREGVASIMVAHLAIPALESRPNTATTLSHNVVTKLLKEELGYKGLIITDALNMKGVSQFYKPGEVDLLALKAGNDILLFSENVPEAIRLIKDAFAKGDLNRDEIYQRVRKILAAKYDVGLNQYKPIQVRGILGRLNTPEAELLRKKLYEKSAVIIENKGNLLPFKNLDSYSFASLSIGNPGGAEFTTYLNKYAPFTHYNLKTWGNSAETLNAMRERLKKHNMVVVSLHQVTSNAANNHGITDREISMLRDLQKDVPVVLVHFGNAYALRLALGIDRTLLFSEDNEVTRMLAPQVLFGAVAAYGRLPVSPSSVYPVGWGYDTPFIGRLLYSIPEEVGMDSKALERIDRIVEAAIKDRATPGAQVLVARRGTVVFEKYYGHTDYSGREKVTENTIYDLASLTKVLATLQAVMFLEERGLIDTDGRLQDYLPELRNSNKGNLRIRDVLLHQAGLQAYLAHWNKTMKDKKPLPEFYSSLETPRFNFKIAENLYTGNFLKDSVWKWTIDSDLMAPSFRRGNHYVYRYSDIGFYLMQAVVERLTNQRLDEFVQNVIYAPIGAYQLGYHPLKRFPKNQIAPTEIDTYWRNELVWGTVHDQGAAMYGGVAGHAGLFGTATDVAIIMQMNLQNGFYGGQNFFISGTIERFINKTPGTNRRGLGWDKPTVDGSKGPTSDKASKRTFGHTGFTGTAAWADPEHDLVYVFISNRVHPSAENQKLIQKGVRTEIQDVLYDSIRAYTATTQR
jgi:beta-glucosidase-like glycosyl hydrolase/CubicO group peptidase (beta-lactamase class C family)